jgi:hypothetical protein
METGRCKHFSIEAEEIYVSGAPVVLRVPIRRCMLAERMIGLISQTAKGSEVAHKLRIASDPHRTHAPAEHPHADQVKPPILEAEIRAAFGPDLEVIHHVECTIQRCKESCTPSYKSLLQHFDLHELADQETGAGCFGANE